jgi:hypothetical protein
MISENSYLIPEWEKKAFCKENQYLLIASSVDEELTVEDPTT